MLAVWIVLGGALGFFGVNAALALIADRRRSSSHLLGGLKVARAVARLEAGEREIAAGQLSEVAPTGGDVSLDPPEE